MCCSPMWHPCRLVWLFSHPLPHDTSPSFALYSSRCFYLPPPAPRSRCKFEIMDQPVINYGLKHRETSAKNVFFTTEDTLKLIQIKQAVQQAPYTQRRRGVGGEGGAAAARGGTQSTANDYSSKVLKSFVVLKGADGQDLLCRQVMRSGKKCCCPVVPLEELDRLFKEHHERATGFSSVEKLYTHVSETV